MQDPGKSIVITGLGLVSPLGGELENFWSQLQNGESGIRPLASPYQHLPTRVAGGCDYFDGKIDQFGEMEKKLMRSIKKGLKLMCREIQMGVASAQLAFSHAGLVANQEEPDRMKTGVIFGCDHIVTNPDEFEDAVRQCTDLDGEFQFDSWAEKGIGKVEPLWLLKYLPNMPACHFAIYHDLRGPNNSITLRESSSNLALTESFFTIGRGNAEVIVVGGTGTRIHPSRSVHASLQEQIAAGEEQPTTACRPFALNREGMVLGEGAGSIITESEQHAAARNAKIYGRIVTGASSCAASAGAPDFRQGFTNVLNMVLNQSGLKPEQIGHINAHGLGTTSCDQAEAEAIAQVLGKDTPVVAPKSNMGNLGAGGGMVETIASVLALEKGHLFPTLGYTEKDPACEINVVTSADVPAGENFINLNMTPQGQASAVLIAKA